MAYIGEFGTIEQETMAIADAVGNEQANDGTISGAIDLVREALASESGTERSETVAEAIHRLAPYIGTGGGGAELGPLQFWPMLDSSITADAGVVMPVFPDALKVAKVGSTEAIASFRKKADGEEPGSPSPRDTMPRVAAGLTVTVESPDTTGVTTAYAVSGTWSEDQVDGWIINATAVRQLDLQFTSTDATYPDDADPVPGTITYTVPELGENEYLVFKYEGVN